MKHFYSIILLCLWGLGSAETGFAQHDGGLARAQRVYDYFVAGQGDSIYAVLNNY